MGKIRVSFAEAFPTVEDVNVVVTEQGKGVHPGFETLNHKLTTIGEFINCHNSLCYNGGFRLGDILRSMVREGATERESSMMCQGKEGSPKGKKTYRRCTNCFSIKVTIKYKPVTEGSKEAG